MNKYFSQTFFPILSISVLIFSEWLFTVTKPSFMNGMTIFSKINILFLSEAVLIFCFLMPILICILLIEKIFNIKNLFKLFALVLSSFMLTCLVLLLIDNFTYTIFSFGVVTTRSFFRLIYLLFLIYIFLYFYKKIKKLINNVYFYKIFFTYIIVLFLYLIFTFFLNKPNFENFQLDLKTNNISYPNIVFITADGVNASNMSLYGYKRKTTPNIDELAKTSLVANNMFTNSAHTLGSIVSLFTGKYPMNTSVIYSPDVLKGKNTLEHFPMLLRKEGYLGYQFSEATYVDMFSVNMISGFNYANGRKENTNKLYDAINKYLDTSVSYFISEIIDKILSRYNHLLFIENMNNGNDVIVGEFSYMQDYEKIENMIDVIKENHVPVFVHTHWMRTHGSKFYPNKQVFSVNKLTEDQNAWDNDFYDDSIYEFDSAVGDFIYKLKEAGEFNNTIIVITSDHGQNYSVKDKIPLVIHFPNDQYHRIINNYVQTVDIVPTLLDYLAIKIPNWIQGDSIFKLTNNLERFIFNASVTNVNQKEHKIDISLCKPPFYQFETFGAVYCGNWYKINLLKNKFGIEPIQDVTEKCNNSKTNFAVYNILKNKLSEFGFDVTSLNNMQ